MVADVIDDSGRGDIDSDSDNMAADITDDSDNNNKVCTYKDRIRGQKGIGRK